MSRITNNIMVNDFMKNYNNNKKRLNKYMNQLSTGKKFNNISEAPIEGVRALKHKTTIEFNDRYTTNTEEGIDWLSTTDQALDDTVKTLRKLRDSAVKGANDTMTPDDRRKMKEEVDQIKEHLIQLGNTTFGDRYVFSGQKTKIAPYEDAPGDDYYTDAFAGIGIDGNVTREISQDVKIDINVTGDEVGFSDIFHTVENLSNDLDAGDAAAIDGRIGELDNHIEGVLSQRAKVGARMSRLEMTKDRLDSRKTTYTKLLSETEDVNMAEKITQLKEEENAHRSSLAVGARLIQPSLIDFLK